MKPSYFVTPRTMRDGVWLSNCDPFERETDTERAAGVWLAVAVGIVLAAVLVSWWSS